MTSKSTEAAAVAVLIRRLHDAFPSIPTGTVQQIVIEIYASYDGCRIREFVSLLVERESRDRLRDLARARASLEDDRSDEQVVASSGHELPRAHDLEAASHDVLDRLRRSPRRQATPSPTVSSAATATRT